MAMEDQSRWTVAYANHFTLIDAVERMSLAWVQQNPDYPVAIYGVLADITPYFPGAMGLLWNPFNHCRCEPSDAEAHQPGGLGYTNFAISGNSVGYTISSYGRTSPLLWVQYIPEASLVVGPGENVTPWKTMDPVAIEIESPPETIASMSSETTARDFLTPVIDGPIHALHVHRGALIVGGKFEHVGTQGIANLAQWKDGVWRGLDAPIEAPAHVYALTTFDGRLVVGVGDNPRSDTNRVLVAGADGWQPWGDALPEAPRCFAVLDGELYVGLRTARTAHGGSPLYRWTGSTWSACGGPPEDAIMNVTDMVVHDGALYVGGSFLEDVAAGTFTRGVRRFRDGNWESVGDGLLSDQSPLTRSLPFGIQGVHDLEVFNGELYATGNFVQQSTGIAGLARWDGSAWQALPSIGTGYRLVLHDDQLVAVGILAHDFGDGVPSYRLGAWDGTRWNALEPDSMPSPFADPVAVAAASFDGMLVMARDSYSLSWLEELATPSLSAWDGSSWSSLIAGDSPMGVATCMREFEGKLVVGGDFEYVGALPTRMIAAWDGESWSAMGKGLAGSRRSLRVHSLLEYQDDLIASGEFHSEVDSLIHGIARWDGEEWSALTSASGGLAAADPFPDDFVVRATTEIAGRLVVAGSFTRAGAASANGLAFWDGHSWTASVPGAQGILALASYDGELYAGGTFTEIGGVPCAGAARWDGFAWNEVDGVRSVLAMIVHDDALILSGLVRDPEGVFVEGVGSYDGSSTELLGATNSHHGAPVGLLSANGRVYASGEFWGIGGLMGWWTAGWDGSAWAPAPLITRTAAMATYRGQFFASAPYMPYEFGTDFYLASRPLPAPIVTASPAPRAIGTSILSATPNPFNPSTRIDFDLAIAGDVVLDLFDVAGRRVVRMESRALPVGTHSMGWDGRDAAGRFVASGVYTAVLRAPDGVDSRRITLLK